jgi:hypothetical protein
LSYGSRRRAAEPIRARQWNCEEDRHGSNVRPRRFGNPTPSARRTGQGLGRGLPRALPTELRSSFLFDSPQSGGRVSNPLSGVHSPRCRAAYTTPYRAWISWLAAGATRQRMTGSGSRVPPARASCLAGRRRPTVYRVLRLSRTSLVKQRRHEPRSSPSCNCSVEQQDAPPGVQRRWGVSYRSESGQGCT